MFKATFKDMPVNIVHEISHLPIEWILIVISIGALHVVGCGLAVICRRFWKWKNGTKEQAYEKVYCEEDPVPVTENNYTENARPQVHNVQQAFFMEDEEKGEAKHVEETISEIKRGNEYSKEKDNLGKVWLSMAYRPTAGRLTVGIFSARNLKKMDVNGKSDPSVKLSLYNGDKRLKKKTTTVKRSTINPVYNETFTFKVPSNKIGEVSLVISVLDHNRFRPPKPIGQFVLGCKRKIICQWHELQAIKDLPVP